MYQYFFFTAGTYLLEIKSENKLSDLIKSKDISCTFYHQWILLCFSRIVSDFRKTHNGSNISLKHIYVPPLLKITMEKLIQNLNYYNIEKYSEEDHELLATINAMSCFFQKLYEVQLEGIGKVDLSVIEKIITETCLNLFQPKIIIEFFLKHLKRSKTKLDIIEQYTAFMNNILKISFLWRKIEKLLSLDSDLTRKIMTSLSRIEENPYENMILKTIYSLVNTATKQIHQLVSRI